MNFYSIEEKRKLIRYPCNKLKNNQIGKTPEQIEQELQDHRLRVEAHKKRKADKIFAEMKEQQRKKMVADMRTTLRQMEQVVIKQQSMMDCSRAILQRQVELLQFTIAEVKRQSALARDIDEEIKNSLDKINKLQQQ
jgi:L-lactate utilization protein LutC